MAELLDNPGPSNGDATSACRLSRINAESLGSAEFRRDYGIKYAYVVGAMYRGIASKEMVTNLGRAGLIGYLGTGGMSLAEVERSIRFIQTELTSRQTYGMNLLSTPGAPELEDRMVDLLLRSGIRFVEAAAYLHITPALVRFRAKGLRRLADGTIEARTRILAKISRPEIAAAFMRPPPPAIVRKLLEAGSITAEEADAARELPVSEDICVEADSGGHTDGGVAYTLMPAMLALKNETMTRFGYARQIRMGAAGGIGSPHAAAAAFIMGADFILTGSINQCTVEAGTSEAVKDLLQNANVQDTDYAPAGDMFEVGAKAQVLKKGLLFPARATKLYELYQRCSCLDEIDEHTRRHIQENYFKRSFEAVWEETKAHYGGDTRKVLDALKNPKRKMAAVFKWYFAHSARLALEGSSDQLGDYQIHCGPAMGAFNQWVKGTELESWRNRRVAEIAEHIMQATAELLNRRFREMTIDDARRAAVECS
jgi:trans-AT polyketide synthase/acyltransferase/oxidoreductase domain-containing protein